MRNTILSLLVVSGLLLGGSAAYAQAVDGRCQSIVAELLGAVNHVEQGIDVVNNCMFIGAGFGEFFGTGCGAERTTGDVYPQNGSCNPLATLCDVIFTCFGPEAVPPGCDDVDECRNP